MGGPKNIKLLADISFERSLQNSVLSSLLLFLCACYHVDLDDIQWNGVATSTARNFNNSWPLQLTFSNMINLCPNIWFIKNSKCQQYFLEKGAAKNTQILQRAVIRNGWPYLHDVDVFWGTSTGFLKSVVLQLFPKYSQKMSIWMSKVGQNSTVFKK